jgi:hypothetical protein
MNRNSRDTGVEQEQDSLAFDEKGLDRAREDTVPVVGSAVPDCWRAICPSHHVSTLGHAPGTIAADSGSWVPLVAKKIFLSFRDVDGAARIIGPRVRRDEMRRWSVLVERLHIDEVGRPEQTTARNRLGKT